MSALASSGPCSVTAAGGGPQVGLEVPATAQNLVDPHANNSPSMAVDPTEPRFLALAGRVDGPMFGCSLQLSGDAGEGWTSADPVPHLPPGVERCYAPVVDFDQGGTLYYLFVGLHGRSNTPVGVFLTDSSDRGQSFSQPRRVLGPNNFMARLVVDRVGSRGRLHLVWLHSTGEPSLGGFPPPANPILAAHSDDGGQTFSAPVQVSDRRRDRVVAPAVAIGPDHAIHVLYYDLGGDAVDYLGLEGATYDGAWSLVVSSSRDGGQTFGAAVVVDGDVVPPERVMLIFTMPPPALAADPRGNLFAAWHDARDGPWDVFVRRSLDGGARWEPPVRASDDPPGDGKHHYLPALAAAPDGRIELVFYDRRNDPSNLRNDVYYAYSTDAGRTFSKNLRLTTDSSDSRDGPRYGVPSAKGLREFGSHPAIVATGSTTFVAWTDTRNVLPEIAQQDLLTVRLSYTSDPAPTRAGGLSAWVLVLAGALGIVAIGASSVAWHRRQHRKAP